VTIFIFTAAGLMNGPERVGRVLPQPPVYGPRPSFRCQLAL